MNAFAATTRMLAGRVRVAEVMLVVIVAAVIAMLVLPVRPWLLDIAIALNLTFGIMLLLSVMFVKSPLEFSTFPSVLLISTLFRLGISVATTRMILMEANGGEIVHQVGTMLTGGNIVVGLVVFLIVMIVMFLVVAKGSERVAEVAARFSLDAMPGKQLSIDSDLRAGLISKDDAKLKRRLVEQESRLYGSLDGAMKFVKGDAITSIIIVVVNLIGGLIVGMFWHGLDLSTAGETFSVLTIGDGLVAQIPALLSALAAGLLVTRTADEEAREELGPTMAAQLIGKPHVLIAGGIIMLVMGLIPGFPTLVFLGLASVLIGFGVWQHPAAGPALRAKLNMAEPQPRVAQGDPTLIEPAALVPVEPLTLRIVGQPLTPPEQATLIERVRARIEALQDASGVRIPQVRLLFDNDTTTARQPSWTLAAYDAPVGAGRIEGGLVDGAVADAVGALLDRNLSLFLGLQEVTDILNWLGDAYPEVVKECVRTVPMTTIADVLKLLVEERVSLRNLRDAVQAIAEAGQSERDPVLIAERVRVAMRRNIVAPLAADGRLRVLMIGSAVEEGIRSTLTMIDGQTRLAIDPFQMRALTQLLREEIANSGAAAILTSQDIRRPLRLITQADMFDVPVLSFNELNPTTPLDVVGEVSSAPDLLSYSPQTEAAE